MKTKMRRYIRARWSTKLNNIQKQRKSQIQIGETISVLLVFFILIIIGFLFYTAMIKANIKSEKEDLAELRSIAIAQRTMFLPELQCSSDNVITPNCIDILKLPYAQDIIIKNEIYYFDMLEFSKINVSQIYPEDASWLIYSRISSEQEEKQGTFLLNVPISLYDPVTRRSGFGILAIETLAK